MIAHISTFSSQGCCRIVSGAHRAMGEILSVTFLIELKVTVSKEAVGHSTNILTMTKICELDYEFFRG